MLLTSVRRAVAVVVLATLLLVLPAGAGAGAGAAAPKRAKCATGALPVTKVVRGTVAYVRDAKGRVRCRRQPAKRPPAPAVTPQGQLAGATERLRDALAVNPRAMRRVERAIGKRRAATLLDAFLVGWRAPAGLRAEPTGFGGKYEGVDGKAELSVVPATGDQSGFAATGSIEGKVDRSALGAFSKTAEEQLPPGVKSATGRLDVSFTDTIARCPDKGRQGGRVKATGNVKLTVERDGAPALTVELSAEVDATYVARVDDQGKWTGIDDLKATTTLAAGGTGESTQTFRSVRAGTGFGTAAILDASGEKGIGNAIERDFGRLDATRSVTAGPKGTWKAGSFPISDLRTEANVLAMAKANVASSLATLAVLEYLRKVARERTEKAPCGGRYTFSMRVQGLAEFATHIATGRFDQDGIAQPTNGDPKTATAWELAQPAPWRDLVFTSKTECPYVDPVSTGDLRVGIVRIGDDRISVKVELSQSATSTASVDCPPDGGEDPPPIPGQPGPSLVGTGPVTFELPLAGGTQPFSGGFREGADGWTNGGTITVTRQP